MGEMPERIVATDAHHWDHKDADKQGAMFRDFLLRNPHKGTEYIRADIHDALVKVAELRGYQRGLIDSHNEAIKNVDAMHRGWQESTFRSSTDDRADESPAAPDPHEFRREVTGTNYVILVGHQFVCCRPDCGRPADDPIHSPDAIYGADIAEEGDEGDRDAGV